MKGLNWRVFVLLLALSFIIVSPQMAAADRGDGTASALISGGHGSNTSGGDDEPGPGDDVEGDPENWLGGQNFVPDPPSTNDDSKSDKTKISLLAWAVNLFSRLLIW